MLTRRSLLAAGAMGGVATSAGVAALPATHSSAPVDAAGAADEQVAKALEEIRDLLRASAGALTGDLATIRSLQKEFLKGHGKFPDFIEVGIDIWESAVSWYVRTRQPMQVTRMGDGRYSMPLLHSNLILRHDVMTTYVGQPYDLK